MSAEGKSHLKQTSHLRDWYWSTQKIMP